MNVKVVSLPSFKTTPKQLFNGIYDLNLHFAIILYKIITNTYNANIMQNCTWCNMPFV